VVDAPLLDPLGEDEEEDDRGRLEEVAQHERAHDREQHREELTRVRVRVIVRVRLSF